MSRNIAIGVAAMATLAVLSIAYFLLGSGQEPEQVPAPVTAEMPADTAEPAETTEATPAAPETPAPAPVEPSFDVVRVDRDGRLVAAGRAEPGARVRLLDDGVVVAATPADSRGEWVMVPDDALAPGDRQLSLEAELADGTVVASSQSVAVSVPEDTQMEALVVMQSPDEPSRVLQGPGVVSQGGTLTLDIIDYADDGTVIFSGQAPAPAAVRVYVDNAPVGEAMADAQGRWHVTATRPIAPGVHEVRIDQVDAQGQVVARLEAPFERASTAEVATAKAKGTVVIQPGNNLWTIAQQLYGSGFKYTVIYQANQSQIRDPDLIYPGQVFETPDADG